MNWLPVVLTLTCATSQPPPGGARAYTQSVKRVKQDKAAEIPVPPPPTGAPASIQIPVTGSAMDLAGRKYTISGTLTLTLEEAPAPPVPLISGVRAAGGTAFITEALSGAALELVGAGLPTTGQLRLTIGDKTCAVQLWTSTLVKFTAPFVTSSTTGIVQVWQQVNNQWTSVAKGPSFTVRVGSAEVPLLPRVDRFLAANGTPKSDFKIHEPLTIEGAGFGPKGDQILINWLWVPVKSWSETRIETQAGDGGTAEGTKTYLYIKTPTGWFGANGPTVHYP